MFDLLNSLLSKTLLRDILRCYFRLTLMPVTLRPSTASRPLHPKSWSHLSPVFPLPCASHLLSIPFFPLPLAYNTGVAFVDVIAIRFHFITRHPGLPEAWTSSGDDCNK
jgi:hypothetical protein